MSDNLRWEIAHTTAKVAKQFIDSSTHPSLREIEFVTANHLLADTLTVIFAQTLQQTHSDATDIVGTHDSATTTQTTQPAQTQTGTRDSSSWYQVSNVLRRQKRNGKDMFLVEWADTKDTSWVSRKNISPAALKQFFADHPQRRRRRQH